MGRIPSVAYEGTLLSHTSWDAIVGKVLELSVDVLVIAGDVVEQEEHWFEAYGPLLSGLEKLGKEGVGVIAVGGNHDYSVFPQLAKHSPHIKVLGLGGTWQRYDYKGVRFVGWSFDQRHMKENPLESFPEDFVDTSLPIVGLLHCEVGSVSSYAPVPSNAFSQKPIPWWVLGHIHKGGFIKGGNAFYCGSPYALDSNEEGPHGVWLLEDKGNVSKPSFSSWKEPELVPLCPYRFERCTIDLDGASSEEDVRTKLTQQLREFAFSLQSEGTLFCKLVLEGAIERSLDITRILSSENLESLWIPVGRCTVRILSPYVDNTVLDVDLDQLKEGKDSIALLANKLLDDHAIQKMARHYKALDEESFNAHPYQLLEKTVKGDEEYEALARQAAKRLLFAMIQGREGGRP